MNFIRFCPLFTHVVVLPTYAIRNELCQGGDCAVTDANGTLTHSFIQRQTAGSKMKLEEEEGDVAENSENRTEVWQDNVMEEEEAKDFFWIEKVAGGKVKSAVRKGFQLAVDMVLGKKGVDVFKEILDRHNAYRCMHNSPQMTWDDKIAQKAQEWATKMKGKMKHSPGHFRSNVGGISHLGENLAWGAMAGKAVDMWYDEIDCTKPKGRVKHWGDGSCTTGHYTQVVWKSSTKLGCGVYEKLTVCMYGPGGNMRGQFEDQVPIPQQKAKDCGAPAVPAGIGGYLVTLTGQSRVDCNSACKADGQSSFRAMGVSGNGKHTIWTCGCSQGNGVKVQCTPGWGRPFQTCKKM